MSRNFGDVLPESVMMHFGLKRAENKDTQYLHHSFREYSNEEKTEWYWRGKLRVEPVRRNESGIDKRPAFI